MDFRKIIAVVGAIFVLFMLVSDSVAEPTYSDYVVKNLPKNAEVLTNGVSHIKFYYGGNKVDSFHINRKYNKSIVIEPILANETIKGLKSIYSYHQKLKDYVVFTNCVYFNLVQGVPVGILKIGEEFYSGSVYNRSALVIYDDSFRISRINMNIQVNGINVDNINQPRMSKLFTLMYTDKWGSKSPVSPKNGLQVLVKDEHVISISTCQQQIPKGGYVLVGTKEKLAPFKVGQYVRADIRTNPNFNNALHVVSGGPTILKNGVSHILAKEERMGYIGEGRYNRTFACITDDDSLIITTVSGKGISLKDEVNLMLKFKCIDGMNFDGGASTSGYYKKNGVTYNLVNSGRLLPMVLAVREKK